MQNHSFESLRETDRWLRKAVVYIPVLSFIVGWGTGVLTTYLVFKDHEKRVSALEIIEERQNEKIALLDVRLSKMESKHDIRIP